MNFSLFPHLFFQSFEELTPSYLQKKGIRLLLTDLDNTLATYGTSRPTPQVRDWINSLLNANISVIIVSNNRNSFRVDAYCHDLGIPYIGHAGKPKRKRLLLAMEQGGATPEHTALLGDQIFTDVLGARLCGFHSFCIEPVCGKNGLWNTIAYILQDPFRIGARRRRRKELEASVNHG